MGDALRASDHPRSGCGRPRQQRSGRTGCLQIVSGCVGVSCCARGRAHSRFWRRERCHFGNPPVWQLLQSAFSYSESMWKNAEPLRFTLLIASPLPCARIV